ncbi:MAG: GWxTD domain-containing protein [Acidobacteria bacterium]|nr:GWxTD domain-containing protein [Acidobacteriota bacterium]
MRSATWALLLLSTCVVSLLDAAELPDRYKKWLEEDVKYILSKPDREIFRGLQTDHERDVFIENFWKKLDPVPITPVNEFREEHYARLAHARDHYGLNTDQYRMWVLLGKPDKVTARPVDNNFYAMEYWDYTRLRIPGLPPDLRLLFYKKWGVGYYILYSPLFDGVRALLTNRTLDPDKREVKKWLTATMDFEFRQATRSISTGLDEFQSQDVIAKMYWSYGDLLDRFRRHDVTAKVVFEGEQSISPLMETYAFHTERDSYSLEIALEIPAQDITFEQVGQKFVARTDIYLKLFDGKERSLDEARDSLTIDLQKDQLDASKTYPLLYLASFPVIPGDYAVELLARDFASGRVGKIRQSVTVAAAPTDKIAAAPLLLAYKLDRGAPADALPFRHDGYRIYPRVSQAFSPGSNVYFFAELSRPGTVTEPITLPLKYRIAQADKIAREFEGKLEIVPGRDSLSITEGFATDGLTPGEYKLRVSVADASGDVTLAERPFVISESAGGNARFLFEQRTAGDAEKHFTLGLEYLNANENEQAATHFGLALDFAPWMTQAGVNLARARILLGETPRALLTLDTVLKDDPENVDALMVRVQALLKLGRRAEVGPVLGRLVALGPNQTSVLNYCAESYMAIGDKGRGMELFRKSIELNPDQPDVASALQGQN